VKQRRPSASCELNVAARRSYDLTRKWCEAALESWPVLVYVMEIVDYAWPLVLVRVDCGRGTYIRAIARDLGEALGVGGYLTELRRTRVGEFGVARAVSLDRLIAEGIAPHLQPVSQ